MPRVQVRTKLTLLMGQFTQKRYFCHLLTFMNGLHSSAIMKGNVGNQQFWSIVTSIIWTKQTNRQTDISSFMFQEIHSHMGLE